VLHRLDLANMSCFSGVGTPLLLDISPVQRRGENHSYVFLPTSKTSIFSLSNSGIQIAVMVLLMFGGGWVSQGYPLGLCRDIHHNSAPISTQHHPKIIFYYALITRRHSIPAAVLFDVMREYITGLW